MPFTNIFRTVGKLGRFGRGQMRRYRSPDRYNRWALNSRSLIFRRPEDTPNRTALHTEPNPRISACSICVPYLCSRDPDNQTPSNKFRHALYTQVCAVRAAHSVVCGRRGEKCREHPEPGKCVPGAGEAAPTSRPCRSGPRIRGAQRGHDMHLPWRAANTSKHHNDTTFARRGTFFAEFVTRNRSRQSRYGVRENAFQGGFTSSQETSSSRS